MSAEDVRQSRSPLRRLGWVVLVAALLSLLLLPLPSASKVWILVVVAFAGVFTLLEARAQGKALAAIMAALLALYLGLSLQRAWILLSSDVLVSKLFAVGMIVLPVLAVALAGAGYLTLHPIVERRRAVRNDAAAHPDERGDA